MESITWRAGTATFCLLAAGKEGTAAFVRNKILGDFYDSLVNIRDSFLADEYFKDAEFCLCILDGKVLYALVAGGASLSLVRQGKKTPILKTLRSTASVVTGFVKPGDVFELETSEGSRLFRSEEPNSVRSKAANIIDRILERLPERRIVVHGGEGDVDVRAKKASLVGLVLLIILGVSVYFGIQRRAEALRKSEYEPKLASAEHDLSEARDLATISRTRARELILRARKTTRELKDQGVRDPRLAELTKSISEHLGTIAGIYEEPASLFFDLTIVAADFEGAGIALSGGELRVLDSKNRRLVGIKVENKSTNVIAGPDYLPDALAAAAYENRSFILSSDGIREVTEDVELVVKPDWDAKDVLVAAFAGNLYVLDRRGNQIWRYPGTATGFLEKEEWLGEGFTKDVTTATAMAIDGSIWTIGKNGEFKVYSLGAPAAFGVSGNAEPFGEVVDLYTSKESDFVYVLDRGNSRISVIAKSGEYVGEYVSAEIARASSIAVSEKDRIVFFLADSKLYSMGARHLDNLNGDN